MPDEDTMQFLWKAELDAERYLGKDGKKVWDTVYAEARKTHDIRESVEIANKVIDDLPEG